MPIYGYIDESGTLVEQQVMTVGLVLLDGRRSADRIAERILKELYPHLTELPKELGKKKLHFADMQEATQIKVARHLAQEKLCGVINSHWHSSESETHQILFSRYTMMIQLLLYKGLELTSGDLQLVIAEQGSPEIYKGKLFADLDKTVELYRRRTGVYRKVGFELNSAQIVRGLQLADFYAGTVRKMWLEGLQGREAKASAPYRQIEHQITLADYIDFR
jgi:hypothetical protein